MKKLLLVALLLLSMLGFGQNFSENFDGTTNFLDISNLSNGVYLSEITEGDNKITKRIVKK